MTSLLAQPITAASSGATAYTAPGVFPTSLYESYYNDATATSAEPQPVISDPVTHKIYPYWLTNPETVPGNDTWEAHPLPSPAAPDQLIDIAYNQILSIANNSVFGNDTCSRCLAALEIVKFVALTAPEQGSNLVVRVCEYFNFSNTGDCGGYYGQYSLGPDIMQALALADVGGYDGLAACAYLIGACPYPAASPLNLTNWFAKPKPNPLPPPKQPTGEKLKVLHLSDLHIDPRYMIGAEANCTYGYCCRANSVLEPDWTSRSAPRYGSFLCDSPYPLITATFQAIPVLAGTENSSFNFSIYTGDLVSHDLLNELSREYTVYTETVLYDLMKRMINTGPVYAVPGNHDTYQSGQNSPYNIGNGHEDQFDWDYEHLADLWELEEWISPEAAQQARKNYAAYSVQRQDGLRIVTLNTDFWFQPNVFNYFNLSSSDNSGMLRWLTDELQDAEDAEERVWILGHVPSGWDDTDPIANPTNLFYQIVDRYSPHVIAGKSKKRIHEESKADSVLGIFFGHTHMDMLTVYYTNNATVLSADTAQTVAWIGPSVVPVTNYNVGFRVYEVDSGTFEVLDSYTYYADVNTFPDLDGQTEFGPTFELEYSAREAYGATIQWGANDPLNATWWHLVTEAMETNSTLVQMFSNYQYKSSIRYPPCTGICIPNKICSIRSGSASLYLQNCA
ncbi:sphingomyelin phosphodiesterase [Rhodofomes roseus]|uniref:Sphingomyelin phosphodiesterase n=1 Tax=Rhodofomes roseus TaxID=34475 RepID=A0ABQ8KJX1_9APHY|nr:sphingomyelin phosphodiesterase [Rhodofomes roseus]KAH9838386.1 sphingomyelin phosphodiesterase [Rhodofomes roseus]